MNFFQYQEEALSYVSEPYSVVGPIAIKVLFPLTAPGLQSSQIRKDLKFMALVMANKHKKKFPAV
uniref:Uncharacterized protein n=1 Tax=Drosophila pseudoobscura pseudoobscura TaxID=46245 RepID=A0A0R3NVZ4_DROPS